MNEFNLPKKFNWELASQPIVKKYVADLYQNSVYTTSGLLVVGVEYVINYLEIGDNFINVGYTGLGIPFIATATTPTVWTNSTAVINVKQSAPVGTVLANNTEVAFSYEYLTEGTYLVTSSKPIFTGCGMGCPVAQHTQTNITNSFAFFSGVAVSIFPISDNEMIILSGNGSGPIDDVLGYYLQNALEITIYP
jgi:hypothetical protein